MTIKATTTLMITTMMTATMMARIKQMIEFNKINEGWGLMPRLVFGVVRMYADW